VYCYCKFSINYVNKNNLLYLAEIQRVLNLKLMRLSAFCRYKTEVIMREKVEEFFQQASSVLLDKENEIRLGMACILANGHLLIEDVPGVGKTTMVHLFSRSLSLGFSRVQFTNDLLPADIVGNSIFDPRTQEFRFHKGPLFGQLVLADELNRATPKTQSALLQAMEERQISIDGHTYELPKPFFVVATQNPRQQVGTFPLPESELDRFLMRLSFGFPNREAEHRLLAGEDRKKILDKVRPVLKADELLAIQDSVRRTHTSPAVINYIQDILDASRSGRWECQGLSPRAGLGLVAAAKAWSWLAGREIVLPEDVQAVALQVISHRMGAGLATSLEAANRMATGLVSSIEVN
jgi:MoxR-like ATPase